jgi:hypothetical protein
MDGTVEMTASFMGKADHAINIKQLAMLLVNTELYFDGAVCRIREHFSRKAAIWICRIKGIPENPIGHFMHQVGSALLFDIIDNGVVIIRSQMDPDNSVDAF